MRHGSNGAVTGEPNDSHFGVLSGLPVDGLQEIITLPAESADPATRSRLRSGARVRIPKEGKGAHSCLVPGHGPTDPSRGAAA